MDCVSKELDDGRVKISFTLTRDELAEIAQPEYTESPNSKLAGHLAGISGSTRYCVTCTLTEKKYDIDVALGDVGANIKATALCGPGLYRYHDGPCP